MNHEQLKSQIGANITLYRKRLGLTQAELAQKLNYSDKAVSKWERGESIPDVLTLADIAEQFGVSVNDLLCGPEARGPKPDRTEPLREEAEEKVMTKRGAMSRLEITQNNRRIIQILASILVWVVALAVYVLVDSFDLPYGWLVFFVAVPANAITLLSLRSAWRMYSWNMLLISAIMWGSLVLLHSIILIFGSVNTWRLFLMGLLGQIAICMWFKLVKAPKEENDE